MLSENLAFVHFQDASSTDVTSWEWTLGDQITYNGSSFYHEFTAPGKYDVNLIVFNDYSCSDTALNQIIVNPALTIFVPNTFTPNGDGLNDTFGVAGEAIQDFDMKIFNRWGQLIYETTNANERWDGTFLGQKVPSGTYVYKVSASSPSGKRQNKEGSVNVIM
jgi:gliding motility-associated-like protein